MMGIGLVFFGWHNKLLAPSIGDTTIVFLPTIGFALIVISLYMLYITSRHRITLGPKWVWMPMAVILASTIARAFIGQSWIDSIASFCFIAMLCCVYLAGRVLGRDLFYVFMPYTVLIAISCIAYAFMFGKDSGGLMANHAAGMVALTFGMFVARTKWQWLFVGIVASGMVCTGSPYLVIFVPVFTLCLLIRRDITRQVIASMTIVAITIIMLWFTGNLISVYAYAANNSVSGTIEATKQAIAITQSDGINTMANTLIDEPEILGPSTNNRWQWYIYNIQNIQPLGHGLYITELKDSTAHAVPLVIMEQLGPVAMVTWCIASLYLLRRGKYKYAILGILVIGLVDHFYWTQFAPLWWALAGVSTVEPGKDYIFRLK